MYTLKLTKGISCRAGTVRASRDNPWVIVKDKEVAENAISTGYFELISSSEDEKDDDVMDVQKMTEKQLNTYALENNIDLTGCKNKSEKLAIILDEKDDNIIDFDINGV